MSVLDFAKHFINCIETGDVDGFRACYHDDAGIWHNYDGKTQTIDENLAILKNMLKHAEKIHYDIKRREEISGGFLQQHTLRITTKDGKSLSTEAIALVFVRDGKIHRLEEYIDPTPMAALRS